MMMTGDEDLRIGHVDGQEMLIPTEAGWERLKEQPEIDGVPLGVLDLLWSVVPFVRKYPEFALGLYRIVTHLIPCVLLRTAEGWQRVHIERLTCQVCGWQGRTANPTIEDLYLGVTDWAARLRAAWAIPAEPCPNCGSQLPRHPISTGPLNKTAADRSWMP